jgi:hypothetical protein
VAEYTATINTRLAPEQAFALMADFANAKHWDPATLDSKMIGDHAVGAGVRFELDMKVFGRENSIVYEIIEFDPPSRVVLRGENAGSVAVDEITVVPRGDGSAVTYAAVVTMKGAFKAISPIFSSVFKKMGDDAKERIGPWLDASADGTP